MTDTLFFHIRDSFFELSLGVLKFSAVFNLKFSLSVFNVFYVHEYINCKNIPYLKQLYHKLDNYYGYLYTMPDIKGKLKKEVISKD